MDIKKVYDMIGGNCPMFFDWVVFYGKVKGAKAYDHFSQVCNPFEKTIEWAEIMKQEIIQK
nr:MAG TPA: hypothetical protein [Caudoviricetes sp.]